MNFQNQSMKSRNKGFTLIELLVVIAIIAILAIVVILTLNPAQLIKQARDSNRVSDLATVKSALAYFSQDVVNATSGSYGTSVTCYEDGAQLSTGGNATSTCPWFALAAATTTSNTSSTLISGTGWIPVNLTLISVGSPIGQLPHDPLNQFGRTPNADNNTTTDFFYSYSPASTTLGGYKLAATFESAKYTCGGSNDLASTDGGTYRCEYEQGSNLNL